MEVERTRIARLHLAAQYKLDEERLEIEIEKKRLADIEAERVRAEEMERAKAEAAEKARVAEKERIARVTAGQVAAEKARAEAEEAARLKAEALRPDCDKLLAVAKAVGAIEIPRVSAAALTSRAQVQDALADASREVRRIVEEMV
jgi:hypothetical protein